MHPIAASVGGFFGGIVAVMIASKVWEKLLFQRVFDDPIKGKLSSVLAGWLTAGIIGGFGYADDGQYAWWAFAFYLFPAILVGVWFYHKGKKLREENSYTP